MKEIISIEKGVSTNNFIVLDVDYSKDKPYLISDAITLKEIGYKDLEELRELNENVEDYNMPFQTYKRIYIFKDLGDLIQDVTLEEFFDEPSKYVEDELFNILGLETVGSDISIIATKNEISQEKSPYKVFFDYEIKERYGDEIDNWKISGVSRFFVDVEKIKSLIKSNNKEALREMLYDIHVKTCKCLNIYFSRINN